MHVAWPGPWLLSRPIANYVPCVAHACWSTMRAVAPAILWTRGLRPGMLRRLAGAGQPHRTPWRAALHACGKYSSLLPLVVVNHCRLLAPGQCRGCFQQSEHFLSAERMRTKIQRLPGKPYLCTVSAGNEDAGSFFFAIGWPEPIPTSCHPRDANPYV